MHDYTMQEILNPLGALTTPTGKFGVIHSMYVVYLLTIKINK